MIYLDNAATTAVSPASAKAASDAFDTLWGNPSSLYKIGYDSNKAIESSRRVVAKALGCIPQELFFTSCGTESNNLAILGAARARKNFGKNIVVSGYEHPSVDETVASLKNEGFEIRKIMPKSDGKISVDELIDAVDGETALCTAMMVNNETGAVIDIKKLADGVKQKNFRTAIHCDCVQAFLKTPFKLSELGIDTASISGHKLHAPKGVGALYIRKGFNLARTQFGGGQEKGVRSGTENTPYIVALAAAIKDWDVKKARENAAILNKKLRRGIAEKALAVVNSPDDASDFVLNVSLVGYRSETVLHFLDERGICVSSGSACSGGKSSHTLLAMGVDDARLDSSLRISFSSTSLESDVDALLDALVEAKSTLVKSGK